jgi:hypothetical protein
MVRFPHKFSAGITLLILVWLLTGVVAFADSLDLSDDIGVPTSQSLQAINLSDADEIKQAFSIVRSPVDISNTLAAFVHENLQFFTACVRVAHTHSSTSRIPLYESLCTYRL